MPCRDEGSNTADTNSSTGHGRDKKTSTARNGQSKRKNQSRSIAEHATLGRLFVEQEGMKLVGLTFGEPERETTFATARLAASTERMSKIGMEETVATVVIHAYTHRMPRELVIVKVVDWNGASYAERRLVEKGKKNAFHFSRLRIVCGRGASRGTLPGKWSTWSTCWELLYCTGAES